MLLVGRLQSPIASIGCHAGIWIGHTDLLVSTRLAGCLGGVLGNLGGFARVAVLGSNGIDVADRQALPTDVRPDQGGIDVNDLALGDPGRDASGDRALEDLAEPLGTPALADAGQRGMIGQRLVQAEADEPTDRKIDLSFAKQTPIMDDSQKEACQHQAHRNFGVDPRPSRTGRVAFRDGFAQPGKIQDAIDADEDVVVWKEVA